MREDVISYIKYAAIGLMACGIVFLALKSVDRSEKLARERRAIVTEIKYLQEYNAMRMKVLDSLNNDAFYVERMLRERFGYKKEGEGETTIKSPTTVGRDGQVARPRSR